MKTKTAEQITEEILTSVEVVNLSFKDIDTTKFVKDYLDLLELRIIPDNIY